MKSLINKSETTATLEKLSLWNIFQIKFYNIYRTKATSSLLLPQFHIKKLRKIQNLYTQKHNLQWKHRINNLHLYYNQIFKIFLSITRINWKPVNISINDQYVRWSTINKIDFRKISSITNRKNAHLYFEIN